MPSGPTHDRITLALVAPTAAVAWALTRDPAVAVVASVALVLGGFMFGPDLDTRSHQYRRWGPVRWVWLPYRWAIRHRSRLSHGILFGTAIRVAYFLVVASCAATAALVLRDVYWQSAPATAALALRGGERVISAVASIPVAYDAAAFAGLWLGAASHTLADIVGSTAKAIWHAL